MSDYYCPNCYADLEMQDGFDPERGYWTCTECGQQLFGDDEDSASTSRCYPGVVWHCDRCDAVLNNQDGFDDWQATWTCTECGSLNFIDEDEIRKNSSEQNEDHSYAGSYDDGDSNTDDEEDEDCYSSGSDNENDDGYSSSSADRHRECESTTRDQGGSESNEQAQENRKIAEAVYQALSKAEPKPLSKKTYLVICLFVLAFCVLATNHPDDLVTASEATGKFLQAWLTVIVHLLEDIVRLIALLVDTLTGK